MKQSIRSFNVDRDDLKKLTKETINQLFPRDIINIFNMFSGVDTCGFKAKNCRVLIRRKGFCYYLSLDDDDYEIPIWAEDQTVCVWRFKV